MSDVPPIEDDRTAQMLGLVPDKRTPKERLLDAIDTHGKLLQEPWGDSDGGIDNGERTNGDHLA
jgi:hypothetical protein